MLETLGQLCRTSQLKDWVISVFASFPEDQTPDYETLLATMSRLISFVKDQIFVIDAIDELELQVQDGELAGFLQALTKGNKVFITSRSRKELEAALGDFDSFEINVESLMNDIKLVTTYHLEYCKSINIFSMDRDELTELITRTTKADAGGVYLWIWIIICRIESYTDTVGTRVVLEKAREAPTAAQGIVEMVRAAIEEQTPTLRSLGKNVVSLLSTLKRPTELEVLQAALQALRDEQDGIPGTIGDYQRPVHRMPITDSCSGLTGFSPGLPLPMLPRLESIPSFESPWTHVFEDGRQHTLNTLLNCLLKPNFECGACRVSSDLNSRLCQFPLYDYAALFWPEHARNMAAHDMETFRNTVDPLIRRLLGSHAHEKRNLAAALQISDFTEDELHRFRLSDIVVPIRSAPNVSSLQIASCFGLWWIVKEILRAQPETVNRVDGYLTTALHEAARSGWKHIAQKLSKAGADVEAQDVSRKIPMDYAMENGNTELISMLKPTGFVIENMASGCVKAAINGHVETFKFLVRNIDRTAMDEAFCVAISRGQLGAIERLLCSANEDDKKRLLRASKDGRTPLILATETNRRNVVKMLIDYGADIDAKEGASHGGKSALQHAISRKFNEIASFLIVCSANINSTDVERRTALFDAVEVSNDEGVDLLLESAIDMECVDIKGESVLHKAVKNGSIPMTQQFLQRGITVDVPRYGDGYIALQLAADLAVWSLNVEIVQLLLKAGADESRIGLWGPDNE